MAVALRWQALCSACHEISRAAALCRSGRDWTCALSTLIGRSASSTPTARRSLGKMYNGSAVLGGWQQRSSHSGKKKIKTKKSAGTGPAKAGRIILRDTNKKAKKNTRAPRLCGGCGVEIVDGSPIRTTMAAGNEAAESSLGSNKKKAAYADMFDLPTRSFLCDRCQSLRSAEKSIWGAYDALQDVDPGVFKRQLQYIVKRRRFGICIKVVDAADLEGSIVRGIRDAVGGTPLLLAFNKIDLLPRPVLHGDLNYMKRRVQSRGLRNLMGAHAVSAKTGEGIADLAEHLLRDLGGRDVFVVGAANVGKSSLVKSLTEMIADSIRFTSGKRKTQKRRKGAVLQLEPTVSHLPGTTLQAIRIPCFASHRHALWDTPGIINDASLTYHVFPSHLMEPLARPDPIEVRPPLHLRPGHSLLMEASWMADGSSRAFGDHDDEPGGHHRDNSEKPTQDDEKPQTAQGHQPPPPVLARLDVTESEYGSVEVRAFVPPCIGIRIVPTTEAPDETIIPKSVLARVKKWTRDANRKEDDNNPPDYANKKLASFVEVRPSGDRGTFAIDVAFASLGWLSVYSKRPYVLDPRCVKGSLFFKREPRMFPPHMVQHDEQCHEQQSADDPEEIRRRLTSAAREGRHASNRRC